MAGQVDLIAGAAAAAGQAPQAALVQQALDQEGDVTDAEVGIGRGTP